MLEEAEKNAALDKSKKALVSIIYEYDNLLAKTEVLTRTMDFTNITKESVQNFFLAVVVNLKGKYKKNEFKRIYSELLQEFTYSYDVALFSLLQSKIRKKGKGSKSSVIDVTDDAIDV